MIKKACRSDLIILFLMIVTVCIVAGGIVFLNITGSTHKYLLPKGFTGWVEVIYEQPGYPALKKEGNSFIYEVPPSGKIMTSSKNVSGPMVLSYVEQDGRIIGFPTDVSMIHTQDLFHAALITVKLHPLPKLVFLRTNVVFSRQ